MISVFGASGFLGSQICNSLNSEGIQHSAVMREFSNPWRLKESMVNKRFFLNSRNWEKYLSEVKPSVVVAAQWQGVSKSLRENLSIQRRNFDSVIELATLSRKMNVNLFVAFGSQAEVPSSMLPIQENFADSRENAYATIKSELAMSLTKLFINSNTNFIWIRPFSIYGPKDSNESLIPKMYRFAQSNMFFDLNEPGLIWSALHVSDFGSAMKMILMSNSVSGVVNVGNPEPINILEFARIAEQSIKRFFPFWGGLRIDRESFKSGKIPQIDKLQKLGWLPRFSMLEGVNDTVNWLECNRQVKEEL